MIDAKIKSRRLGYLKILGKYITGNPSLRVRLFNKRFEDFVLLFESGSSFLNEHSGGITANNGKSAKPYIELAQSLMLLVRSGEYYVINEEFRIFALQKDLIKESNIFELDFYDFQFFFNRLMLFDGEIIKPLLLSILKQNQTDKIRSLRKEFLLLLISSVNDHGSEKARQAISRLERSKFYKEELFLPRLHWLLDLKIIVPDSKENKIIISEFGFKVCADLELISSK